MVTNNMIGLIYMSKIFLFKTFYLIILVYLNAINGK